MVEKVYRQDVETGELVEIMDENGWEVPDPKPMAIPAGFRRPETLAEQVQRLVRSAISREAEGQGMETFEESEDFDIEDEPDDPSTVYETFFDPIMGRDISAQEFKANEAEYRRRYLEGERAKFVAEDQADLVRSRRRAPAAPPKAAPAPEVPPAGDDDDAR